MRGFGIDGVRIRITKKGLAGRSGTADMGLRIWGKWEKLEFLSLLAHLHNRLGHTLAPPPQHRRRPRHYRRTWLLSSCRQSDGLN